MDEAALVEQIQGLRVQALELKNGGDRRGALETLRRAKAIEVQLRKLQETKAEEEAEAEESIFVDPLLLREKTKHQHGSWNAPSRAVLRRRNKPGEEADEVTALEHLSVLHDERAAVRGPRNRRDLRVVHQGKQLTVWVNVVSSFVVFVTFWDVFRQSTE